eukprot:GHVT01050181.1.p1 GENE.GHVT01050181.1~~GHVT01050181.1.p1  ORF type:complete len:190 (-),score=15.77 GHVT01050181.1:24-593(-)
MTGLSGSVRRLPGLELLRLRSPFVRPNFAWPGVGVAGNVWTVPLGGHFVKQYDNFCIKHCRTFTAPAAATGRGASSLGAENDREKLPANVGDSPAGAPSTGRRRGARVSAPRAAPSSLFAAYAPPGISSNFMEVVGRTALVKLRGASDLTGPPAPWGRELGGRRVGREHSHRVGFGRKLQGLSNSLRLT